MTSAQPLTIEADLSDTSLMVGDILTVQLSAVAQVNGQLAVDAPAIDGLTELGRSQSEGTSISWTNAGQSVRREVTVSIEYSADKPGKLTIPPYTARVGKLTAQTKPLTIEVVGSAEAPKEQAGAGAVVPPDAAERQLFVRYRVDRTEAFLGEQILVDLEIFALPGRGFSVDERESPPQLDGFWTEVVDQPNRLNRRVERVGGKKYDVYRAWRIAIFPLSAGKKIIAPSAITFSSGRSLFSSGRRIRRRALPVELTIKPLPTEGRPADFSNNNVGQFALKASVDHQRVPAGKAVLLTLTLSGRGNVKNTRLPQVEAVDGFRVFPPTVEDQQETSLAGLKGKKSASYLLMPTRGGRLEIPGFDLTIFDPETKEYRRLSTSSIRIVVEGDPSAEAPRTIDTSGRTEPDQPKIARSDLAPLRFRSKLRTAQAPIWKAPLFTGLMAGPPLLFLLGVLGEIGLARLRRETPASKKKAASQAARQRLTAAKAAADAGDLAKAYAEFAEAVTELGTLKCGVPLRGLTTEEIARQLREKRAPELLVAGITTELEAADYARFAAGAGASSGDRIDTWTRLLQELDTWQPEADA